MKNYPESFEIAVDFEGKKYLANYSVSSGVVTVWHAIYDSKSTQIGGSTAKTIAILMFYEILREAKNNGELAA